LSATIKSQLRDNAIAIISLVVALASFSYTAWRMQHSEHNLTTRDAAFQMLVALGAMKQVVYHGHYDHDKVGGNPRTGWVYGKNTGRESARGTRMPMRSPTRSTSVAPP